MPVLSVIVPVYNEERTVGELLRRVAAAPYPFPDREVIVVDDGSTDRTPGLLREWGDRPGFRVLGHPRNRGKGAAVRTGLAAARGEVVLVQDADLEYDPGDYPRLVGPILRGEADAVYGSRYLGPAGRAGWDRFRAAVWLLNGAVRLLYGRRLTDEATGYKALRRELVPRLCLEAERFELCPEITAKLCRLGVGIVEVPVSYTPRTARDGKKIGWRDVWPAFATLVRWRFAHFPPPAGRSGDEATRAGGGTGDSPRPPAARRAGAT
ncbi:MAG: glycosyltransferase family 2 protein [Gemmataceae bacterium]|nr:glycosyltransferase family 2 protein [Gemmataceae bacterium]